MSLFNHFEEMCFPQLGEGLSELEWRLRYGTPSKSDLMVAASVVSAYSGLVLRKTQQERNHICQILKRGESHGKAE